MRSKEEEEESVNVEGNIHFFYTTGPLCVTGEEDVLTGKFWKEV